MACIMFILILILGYHIINKIEYGQNTDGLTVYYTLVRLCQSIGIVATVYNIILNFNPSILVVYNQTCGKIRNENCFHLMVA